MTREPGTSERENGFREPGIDRYVSFNGCDPVITFVGPNMKRRNCCETLTL